MNGLSHQKGSFVCRIPIIGSREKLAGLIICSLTRGELVRVRIAGSRICARAGGVVLGVEDRIEVVRLTRMPFAPARRLNVTVHLAVQVNHRRIRPPWPPQEDMLLARIGGEMAMIEDERGVLSWLVFALGGDVSASGMLCVVDLAVVEYSVPIAIDEIHIACDDTVRKVAPRGGWCARSR